VSGEINSLNDPFQKVIQVVKADRDSLKTFRPSQKVRLISRSEKVMHAHGLKKWPELVVTKSLS
jgi:hypothetical protein